MTTTAHAAAGARSTQGTGSGTGDAWRVIVLNDNHNTFEGVAFALAQTIPGRRLRPGACGSRPRSTRRARRSSGRAHRELAELYHAQLEGYGLTMAPLERLNDRSGQVAVAVPTESWPIVTDTPCWA